MKVRRALIGYLPVKVSPTTAKPPAEQPPEQGFLEWGKTSSFDYGQIDPQPKTVWEYKHKDSNDVIKRTKLIYATCNVEMDLTIMHYITFGAPAFLYSYQASRVTMSFSHTIPPELPEQGAATHFYNYDLKGSKYDDFDLGVIQG
jgi:hypothetical protein